MQQTITTMEHNTAIAIAKCVKASATAKCNRAIEWKRATTPTPILHLESVQFFQTTNT